MTDGAESREKKKTLYDRWVALAGWPMAICSLIFVGAYAYVVIGNLREQDVQWPFYVMFAIWVVYVIDYVVSLVLVKNRVAWFFKHLHLLVIVIFPFLRPLYMLRLITFLKFFHRKVGARLRGQATVYIIASSTVLVFVGSLAVLDAEQNAPDANITNYGDALWWAFVTITTVGYGDYYPVTLWGRLIAGCLMISGIALIGSVTATLASWVVDMISDDETSQQSDSSDAPLPR